MEKREEALEVVGGLDSKNKSKGEAGSSLTVKLYMLSWPAPLSSSLSANCQAPTIELWLKELHLKSFIENSTQRVFPWNFT